MSHTGNDPDLETLREEVRRTAGLAGWLRFGLCTFVPILLVCICWFSGLRFVTWPVAIGVFLLTATVAERYRRSRQAGLRERLTTLPLEQQARVLLPLHDDPLPDTRRFVAPLLRELNVPTEPTPAASPEGRGDEASPSG